MVRARENISDASSNTEIPFEPMVFPTTPKPIPVGPPDTASLTAMPEAKLPTTTPTDNDWRENTRWIPLVGTPSRTPIPSGTLVPDPSPARSCSDTASDVLIPPSPAGSFVHRRRRGEYAQRPPVWSIQALVEDTKGWHEMGKRDYDYSLPWSGRTVSSQVSYANQLEKMACVMTEEPLIVRMAIDATPAEAAVSGHDAGPSKITTPEKNVEEPAHTDKVPSRAVLPSSSELVVPRVRQDQPSPNVRSGRRHPSAAEFINEMVRPWLATIPPAPDGKEYQHSFRRELLRSYTDVRSEANIQIMPGALVVCVGATNNFTAAEDRSDQFNMVFGGLYRVLQVFGDTWAFCRKLSEPSVAESVESSIMPDITDVLWARQKLFGAKKELCFMVIEPDNFLNFLPLCAVTLLENFEEYCRRAQIGPGLNQHRTASAASAAAVAAPCAARSHAHRAGSGIHAEWELKAPHEGGLVKAAPRFTSLDMTFNQYRKPAGVLVPLWVYCEYLKPILTKKPARVWIDREAVDAAFEEVERVVKHSPETEAGPSAPVEAGSTVATMNGRFDTVSLRTVNPADSASIDHRDPASASTAVRLRAPTEHTEYSDMILHRSPARDSMSGVTARGSHSGTWKKFKFATQRLGTQGRQRVKEYFAAPEWVTKSQQPIRSMF